MSGVVDAYDWISAASDSNSAPSMSILRISIKSWPINVPDKD